MRFDQTTALALRRLFWSVYGQYVYDRGAAAPSGTVSLRMASLDRPLPFGDAGFDHGILASVLQAVADPRFTLGELWRVLKPGGTLVVARYSRPPMRRS